MTAWVNRVIISAPRNGTASHTVDPATSGTVLSGAAFAPTAGRLLVAVIEGAVTSTGTTGGTGSTAPPGWSGGAASATTSAVNNTGLYVAYKTAAGADTLTVYHNATDYPIAVAFYEFPTGSTFAASIAAINVALTAANPNLTGLTGTNLVMAAIAGGYGSTATTPPPSTAWSGTGTPTTDLDSFVTRGGTSNTDGWVLSIADVQGYTGTSWQPTGNLTAGVSGAPNKETLTWAVTVPTGGGTPATVTAVVATATVKANPPTVTGGGAANVTAVAAGVTVAAVTPTVTAASSVTGGGAATVGLAAVAPAVAAGANITPSAATVTVAAFAPTVSGSAGANINPPAATVAVSARPPAVSGARAVTVTPPVSAVTVNAYAPAVSAGSSIPASVTATVANVSLTANPPMVLAARAATITPPVATVTALATPPMVLGLYAATINATAATITVTAHAPTVGQPQAQHNITVTATLDPRRWDSTLGKQRWAGRLE